MEPWGFTLELIPFTGNIADNGSMPQKIEKKSKAETRFLAIFFICTRLMGKPAVPLKFATDCILYIIILAVVVIYLHISMEMAIESFGV